NGLMRTMQFQLKISGTWTTEHTTSYDYASSVTKDATSMWYVPANSTEWTNLLSGTGFANPDDSWLMQESSGNLADSIGTRTLTATGTISYQVAATGWTRKGIKVADKSTSAYASTTIPNVNTTSGTLLQIFSLNTNPASGFRALN